MERGADPRFEGVVRRSPHDGLHHGGGNGGGGGGGGGGRGGGGVESRGGGGQAAQVPIDMTPAAVVQLCRDRGGYIKPALNTTLYLQQVCCCCCCCS